jgi:hypothetical protein
LTPFPALLHTGIVQQGKNYLIFLFAVMAIAGAAIAWSQHLDNIELGVRLGDTSEHDQLQKQVAELQAKNSALQDQNKSFQDKISALQEQIITLTAQAQEAADQKKLAVFLPGSAEAGPGVGTAVNLAQPVANDVPAAMSSAQMRAVVDQRYGALISSLNLSPEQAEQFKNLLAAKMQAAADAANALMPPDPNARPNMAAIRKAVANAESTATAQIQAQFGDTVATQYQQYQQTFPQRNTINQFANSLNSSSTPLSDDQAAQLVQILTQTQAPIPAGGLGRILDGGASYHSRITPETLKMAAGVLTVEQLTALQQFQKQQ